MRLFLTRSTVHALNICTIRHVIAFKSTSTHTLKQVRSAHAHDVLYFQSSMLNISHHHQHMLHSNSIWENFEFVENSQFVRAERSRIAHINCDCFQFISLRVKKTQQLKMWNFNRCFHFTQYARLCSTMLICFNRLLVCSFALAFALAPLSIPSLCTVRASERASVRSCTLPQCVRTYDDKVG